MAERRINGELITDNEFNQKPDWYAAKATIGAVSLIGLAALAAKAKGPIAKSIAKVIDEQNDNYARSILTKYSDSLQGAFTGVTDFKSTVMGPDGKQLDTSNIAKEFKTEESFANIHDINNAPSQTKLNEITTIENRINKVIRGVKKGDSLYSALQTLQIGTKDLSGLLNKSDDEYVIIATKIASLKKYLENSGEGFANAPAATNLFKLNLTDKLDTTNVKEIISLHEFYLENDKNYVDTYHGQIRSMKNQLYINKAGSKAFKNDKYLALADNDVLNPGGQGAVGAVFKELLGGNVSFEDQSVKLFTATKEAKLSEGVVKKTITGSKIFSKDAEHSKRLSRYKGRLTKLGNTINSLVAKHSDRISGGRIEYKSYNASYGKAEYYEIVIDRITTKGEEEIRIPVPIVNGNNLMPNVRGTEKSRFINAEYKIGSPGMINDNFTINSSQVLLDKLDYMLNSSMFNDSLDAETGEIEKDALRYIKALGNTQAKGSLFSGEERDVFKMNQVRSLYLEEYHSMNTLAKNKAAASWKSGISSMMNMHRMKANVKSGLASKEKVITIDLETLALNTTQASPHFTSSEKGTSLWNFGMVVSDGSGAIIDQVEIANDHVLKEQKLIQRYEDGSLRKLVEEDNTYKKFAIYAQRTVEGAKNDSPYDALVKYIEMIKNKSKISSKHTKMSSGINSQGFAKMVMQRLKNEVAKHSKDGSNVTIQFANGREFDMTLLQTLVGGDVMKQLTHSGTNVGFIDITDISRMLSFGQSDISGKNVESILKTYGKKQGLNQKNLDFSIDPKTSLEYLEQQGIIKIGNLNSKFKGSSVFSMVESLAGEGNGAHSSTTMDVTHTLAAARLMMDSFNESDFEGATKLMDFISTSKSADMSKILSDYMQNAGMSLDDNFNEWGSGLANGLLGKRVASRLHISHYWAFAGPNPLNRNLHQMGRNSWAIKNDKTARDSAHRYRTGLISELADETNNMLHVEAGRDRALYTNKLNYRTVFAVGAAGMQAGHAGVMREVMNEHSYVTFKDLQLDMMPTNDSKMFNQFKKLKKRIIKRAVSLAKEKNFNSLKKSGKLTNALFEKASRDVLANTRSSNLPTIDPNNPIHRKMVINKNEFQLENNVAGTLAGIKLNKNAHNDDFQVLYSFAFEAKDGFLSGGAFNIGNHKAVPTVLDATTSTVNNWVKKYGLYDAPEMITNIDFIEKGFSGTSKQILVEKAIGYYNSVLSKGLPDDHGKVLDAKRGMRKLTSVLDANIPGGAKAVQHNDGTITMKYGGDLNIHPSKIINNVGNMNFDEIFSSISAMGHEMVWDQEQLTQYYGYFGGDNNMSGLKRGAHNLSSILAGETKGKVGSASASEVKQLLSMADAKGDSIINKYLNPLSIIEKHLKNDSRAKKKFGSALGFLTHNDKKTVEKYLNDWKIPIFMQRVPNLNVVAHDQGKDQGILGIFGDFGISSYAVNTEKTVSYNHPIPVQHSYFDMIMDSDYLADRDKSLLLRSIGVNIASDKLDSARTIESFVNSFRAKTMSDMLTSHTLNIDEINLIATRSETLDHINDLLKESELYTGKQSDIIKKAVSEIKSASNIIEDLDTKKTVEEHNLDLAKNKFDRGLESRKGSQRYISTKQATSIVNLGAEKKGIAFLGLDLKKKQGQDALLSGNQKFRINVLEMLDRVKHVDNKSLDVNATLRFFRNMQSEAMANANLDPKSRMFNIIEDNVEAGKFEIEMAGFAMPINRNIKNIMNKNGDVTGLGTTTKQMQYTQDVFGAYKMYYDAVTNGDTDTGTLKDNAIFKWMRFISNGISMDKNSNWFKSTMMSEPLGLNVKYQVSDLYQNKARRYSELMDKGKFDAAGELMDFFTRNGYSKDQQSMFRKQLKMVANSDANTVLIGAKTLFNPNQKFNVLNSKTNGVSFHTFNEMMRLTSDGALKDSMMDMKNGLAYLPGGFTRFPITSNGREGIMTKNILAIPDAIARFLGMDPEKAHLNSVIGELVKADTDRDMVPLMLQLYETQFELDEHRIQTQNSIKALMNNVDVKNQVDAYNADKHIIGTFKDRNGTLMAKVQHILPNGDYKENISPLSDLVGESRASKLANVLHESSTKMTPAFESRLSEKMERHLMTTQLGAFSSNIIGMATNTIRETAHEILAINNAVPGVNIIDTKLVFGSLDTGLGGLAQLPIKSVKKNSGGVEAMTEVFAYWSDPSRASADQYKEAKQAWVGAYEKNNYDKAIIKEQGKFFDLMYGSSEAMKSIFKEAPEAAQYMKFAKDKKFGRESMDIMKYMSNTMYDDEAVGKFDHQFAKQLQTIFGQKLSSATAMAAGDFDANRFYSSFNKTMAFDFLDPVTKKARTRMSNILSDQVLRKGGKFGAIGALAFLGANLFRPNQMSSSMNPLDGFVQISPTHSDNNIISSELQLDRRIKLDQVDASFSKEAFYYDKQQENLAFGKIAKSKTLTNSLNNTFFRTQTNTKIFSQKLNYQYNDLREYIGPFGNSNLNRIL